MLLRDRVEEYYLGKGLNCAEAILHAANDAYELQIPPESIKLLSGFGGGMGCGNACGALCGGIAALGYQRVDKNAHNTPGLKCRCGQLATAFANSLGSTQCRDIAKRYKTKETGCLTTILMAADVLEEAMNRE